MLQAAIRSLNESTRKECRFFDVAPRSLAILTNGRFKFVDCAQRTFVRERDILEFPGIDNFTGGTGIICQKQGRFELSAGELRFTYDYDSLPDGGTPLGQ
mgnify:CR=1 FL=1